MTRARSLKLDLRGKLMERITKKNLVKNGINYRLKVLQDRSNEHAELQLVLTKDKKKKSHCIKRISNLEMIYL